MAFTQSSADLLKRLRLQFPVNIKIPDPLDPAAQVELSKDNLFSMLVIDGRSMDIELQAIAAQFMMAARAHRAAEKQLSATQAQFRAWKSHMMNECARTKEGKAPTVAEKEDYYRSSPAYSEWNAQIDHWTCLVGLMEDLKDAFSMKSFSLRSMSRTGEGVTHTSGVESTAKVSAERLEELAIDAIEASARDWYQAPQAGKAPPAATPSITAPPALPTFDDSPTVIEDEDEDDEEEDEEDEEDLIEEDEGSGEVVVHCKECNDPYYADGDDDNGFCQDSCEAAYKAKKASPKKTPAKAPSKSRKASK